MLLRHDLNEDKYLYLNNDSFKIRIFKLRKVITMKTLVVYYSRTGTTDKVAKQIASQTDADIFELATKLKFPTDMSATSDLSKEQYQTNKFPELIEFPNIAEYDRVLIGSPIWNGQLSTPIVSYLKQQVFTTQTVAGFCTSMGSVGDSEQQFSQLAQSDKIKTGLFLDSGVVSDVEISQWLSR